MKKKIKKFLFAIEILLGSLGWNFLPVFAEENTLSVSVPIQADNGAIVKIESVDDAPAPSKNSIQIDSSTKGTFEFSFSEPGTYEYTVSRTDTGSFNSYHLFITVFSDSDFKLTAYKTAKYGNSNDKSEEISFLTPAPSPSPTPAPPSQTPSPAIQRINDWVNTGVNGTNVFASLGALVGASILLAILIRKKKENENETK